MIRTRRRHLSRFIGKWHIKSPQINYKNPQVIWWFSCCGYVFLTLFLLFGPLFRISSSHCKTNTSLQCPDFVEPELRRYFGQLIYFVQPEKIAQKIQQNIPEAQQINLYQVWPSTLSTEIIFQPGFATLSIPASTSAFLMSKTGQIIDVLPTPDSQLPLIVASSAADLIISDKVTEPSLQAALQIITSCRDYGITVKTVDVRSAQNIIVTTNDEQTILFTSIKPIWDQVLRLQLIFSQTTIDYNHKIIDVRYDRPALKQSL